MYKEASSLTYTSLVLKKKSDTWDPKDNRIVQVTRRMADAICHMTQYLKKKGPILVITTGGHFSAFILTLAATLINEFFIIFRIKKRLLPQLKTLSQTASRSLSSSELLPTTAWINSVRLNSPASLSKF